MVQNPIFYLKKSSLTMAAPTLIFFISLLHVCIITILNTCNAAVFPAILIFGDSTVDTGNNDYILSYFKSNHYPYGIEFPGQIPTGRFSSGKVVPDFLASDLKIKELVPPFLNPSLSGDELKTGVSFASGGSGYDDLTNFGSVTSMPEQIVLFKVYLKKLESVVGREEANNIVSKSLVVISSGTNDFCFNYYDTPTRSLQFNVSGYQDFLQNRLRNFIQELYNLGCRTILIAGLPPIGCLPIQMTVKLQAKCLEDENSDAQAYNYKLQKLLPQIQRSLPGSKLVYADVYDTINDMILNPKKYGFVVTNRGCCGTGLVEAGSLCSSFSPVCQNPSQYLFWDSIHPGQSAYWHLAKHIASQIS